ncbi:hypothetical protein [uncultured Bacteroides sp.]|uniref:hypothetical protein n=1 Tax=uncultured Bacteroides sp. TaxID=162156 RepID=UPI00280BB999|nr:hypothetical protein [uncultured Bacteroides sp.]
MEQVKIRNEKFQFFLLIYIVAITGFMSFFGLGKAIYLLTPIVLYKTWKEHKYVPSDVFRVVILMFVLFFIQNLYHQGTWTVAVTQSIRMLTLALCAVWVIKDFRILFPLLIYYISVWSLIFWIGCMISSGFQNTLISIAHYLPELRTEEFLQYSSNPSESIYVYTINTANSIRNSGPFWEPGMFTVFITMALAINLFNGLSLFNMRNIILLLANISTFSTTGYVATLILLVFYVFIGKKVAIWKLLFLLCIPLVIWQVMSLDFMQEKIMDQMAQTDVSYSRFGALFYHLEKIKLAPLIGYGVNEWPTTTMDIMMSSGHVSPNGISIIAVIWGIPLALGYFYLLYKSLAIIFYERKMIVKIAVFIVVLTLLFSQDVTNRDFFYLLIFLGIISLSQKEYAKCIVK